MARDVTRGGRIMALRSGSTLSAELGDSLHLGSGYVTGVAAVPPEGAGDRLPGPVAKTAAPAGAGLSGAPAGGLTGEGGEAGPGAAAGVAIAPIALDCAAPGAGRKYSRISSTAAWPATVRASTRLRQMPKNARDMIATISPRNVFIRAMPMPPAKFSG